MEYSRSVIQLMSHFELTARELSLSGRWEKRAPSSSPLPERTEYVQSWITP